MREIRIGPGVLRWLLNETNPSIRYHAMVDLLGRGEEREDVAHTKGRIDAGPWVKQILDAQKEDRYWGTPAYCYAPKWSSCVWQLIVLADLAASGNDPRIRAGCEHFLGLHNVADGGFTPGLAADGDPPHVCLTGNMVRTLLVLGYREDERVWKAVDWLLENQLEDGGWNCWKGHQGHSSLLSTIQPLWAFSEIPEEERRPEMRDAIALGVAYYLRHRLYKSSRDDSIIDFFTLKFHYPIHYFIDVLHGLHVLTSFGVRDERLNDALELLLAKKQDDDTWLLEGVPRGWRLDHPMHGKIPEAADRPEEEQVIEEGWGSEPHTLQLEEAGKPSKMITLNALRVLRNLDLLRLREEFSQS